MSETLRRDHPQSTRTWAIFLGSPWIWRPWGELHHTVQTGETGVTIVRLGGADARGHRREEAGAGRQRPVVDQHQSTN
jgi:hypothetical protein